MFSETNTYRQQLKAINFSKILFINIVFRPRGLRLPYLSLVFLVKTSFSGSCLLFKLGRREKPESWIWSLYHYDGWHSSCNKINHIKFDLEMFWIGRRHFLYFSGDEICHFFHVKYSPAYPPAEFNSPVLNLHKMYINMIFWSKTVIPSISSIPPDRSKERKWAWHPQTLSPA